MVTNNVSSSSSTGRLGIFGLAFIVLLVFKLAGLAGASWGLATLSWWVVFSPLIIGFTLALVFMAIVLALVWIDK